MNVLKKQNRIKAINATCGEKGLNISTDERRAIQLQVTGKQSLTEMSLPELDDVLSHLNRLRRGSDPADEWRFVFRLKPDRQIYGKKIYRLSQRIGAMQKPPVPVMSKAYIEGNLLRNIMGTTSVLEFCEPEQLHKIVQALEIHIKRNGG